MEETNSSSERDQPLSSLQDVHGSSQQSRRYRADVRSSSSLVTANPSSEDAVMRTERVEGVVIWGTTVNIEDCRRRFERFLRDFKLSGDTDPFYTQYLEELVVAEEYNLNLNCENLSAFDAFLYNQLIRYPQEIVQVFDATVEELAEPLRTSPTSHSFQVRPFNLRHTKNMRDLNPQDIDQLVSIRGMVIRTSQVIPELYEAFFECEICQKCIVIRVDRGRVDEPARCTSCGAERSMKIIHNRSGFMDKQLIKMQESPEAIPEGETPHTVNLCCFEDLVDFTRPGDRVEVTGIYRAVPIRVNPKQRTVKSIYKTFVLSHTRIKDLDVLHIRKSDKGRMGESEEMDAYGRPSVEEADPLASITKEKEEEFRRIAEAPDLYDLLVRSLAPSIWEHEDVKKGMLCQLFGGTNKELSGSGRTKYRGEINVLLVGDPGVSKSQLLQFVHRISSRGIYTSGKGSSAVGLTAYVTKDPDTGEAVLESGALVLSDRGICCIDEFDKMNDSARSVLHEVMEQQTVSVAKAGIIATLNARTSVLASANPVGSRYIPSLSIVENIQLPPTLLSRFDLIYLMLDHPNEQKDRQLARHIVSLYSEGDQSDYGRVLSVEKLSQYITYAKRMSHPVLTDEAMDDLVEGYCEMRKMGSSRKSISATPRQLESLIRLAEGHAKMRLSDTVERLDVAEAIRLMKVALHQAALNHETGLIDLDLLLTGRTAVDPEVISAIVRDVQGYLNAHQSRSSFSVNTMLGELNSHREKPISSADLRTALRKMEEEDRVISLSEDLQTLFRR